jgi:hypothetical protein
MVCVSAQVIGYQGNSVVEIYLQKYGIAWIVRTMKIIEINEITGEIETHSLFECGHCDEESAVSNEATPVCPHCGRYLCPCCSADDCPH